MLKLMSGRRRFWIVAVLLIALGPWMLGCHGRFPLTRTVYKFNDEVSPSPVVQTLVFWALVIIPVYELAMLGDALIFNVIEFWTADRPLEAAVTTTDANGNKVVLAPAENGADALLTVSREGQVVGEVRFVRVSDSVLEVRDVQGDLWGKLVRDECGDTLLMSAQGQTIRTLSNESIAVLHGGEF